MIRILYVFAILALCLATPCASAAKEKFYRIKEFSIADGLAQEHFGDIVQDRRGYVWIASWNGLLRYDGYRFYTFRPSDKATSTNRIMAMRMGEGGMLYCETRDRKIHLFDTESCRFVKTLNRYPAGWPDGKGFEKLKDMTPDSTSPDELRHTELFVADRDGNLWLKGQRSLALMSVFDKNYTHTPNPLRVPTRALMTDSRGTLWKADKSGAVAVGSRWLAPDGTLADSPRPFAAHNVYAMTEDGRGRIMLGTKGGGLYILEREESGGKAFGITHVRAVRKHSGGGKADEGPDCIYDIAQHNGKTLVATWGAGIATVEKDHTLKTCKGFGKNDACAKVRCLKPLKDGTLLAGTAGGLVAMKGRRQKLLLPGSDIMQIAMAGRHAFVAIYGMGLCRIDTRTIFTDRPEIKEFPTPGNSQANIVQTATTYAGSEIWMFGELSAACFNTKTSEYTIYDEHNFGRKINFTEAKPVTDKDGSIIAGTGEGTFRFMPKQAGHTGDKPYIAISGIQYQGDDFITPMSDIAATLRIEPGKRSFALFPTTLDYKNTSRTDYMYILEGMDSKWNYTLRSNSISYSNLPPGTYTLVIRSSNAERQWIDNSRRITIDVVPLFTETVWFKVLMAILAIAAAAAGIMVYRYIRRIHARQRQLEEYCSELLTKKNNISRCANALKDDIKPAANDDEVFVENFIALFKKNLTNSEMTIDDFARQMGMSHSMFYRKVKQSVGRSPIDFIKTLRIQNAVSLFDAGCQHISEAAYKSGFSEPKYFSKCFKQVVGMTPKEYVAKKQQ